MQRFQRALASIVRFRVGRERGARGAVTHIHFSIAYCFLPALLLTALVIYPGGCATASREESSYENQPIVRVLVLQGQTQVQLEAPKPPTAQSHDGASTTLNLSPGSAYAITCAAEGFRIGASPLGQGELRIIAANRDPQALKLNGHRYRGELRMVPTGNGRFDVVNDVGLEDYLMGVLARELLPDWQEETYKAQAVIARTYALYERDHAGEDPAAASGKGKWFDLFSDQRSQVYGGLDAETAKSRSAVAATAGIIVVPSEGPSRGRPFKAYFSSCCGGIGQSEADAFGHPYSVQLGAHDVHGLCSISTKYAWGPMVISKAELTRRFRAFGGDLSRIGQVAGVRVQQTNSLGRPIRFLITDDRGVAYSLRGEDFRVACNRGAADSQKLLSSYVTPVTEADGIRFTEGHGFGHGVGMCQWCSEARARQGMPYGQIVIAAYDKTVLATSY